MITKICYTFFALDFEHRFLMKFLVSIKFPLKWLVTWHVLNFAYSAISGGIRITWTYFRRKPNFSRPSNNGIPCSEVKPSILKSAYSTTLRLYTKKGKYKTSIYYTYEDNHVNYHRYKQKQDRFTCQWKDKILHIQPVLIYSESGQVRMS